MGLDTEAEIEAIKEAYAALNRGDVDGFVKDFDAKIVRIEFAGLPTGGTYRGLAAVKDHIAQGRSTWAEGACGPTSFVIAGDKVIVALHIRVRLKDQPDWIEGRIADVFTFRGGGAIEFRSFAEEKESLEYAGIQ